MKKALIISIKYAPGMPKEFFLIGNNLKKEGWYVDYLLSSEYEQRIDKIYKENSIKYIDTNSSNMINDYFIRWKYIKDKLIREDISKNNKYDYICIYNPHPLASKIMNFFKKRNPNSKLSVVLHEPFVPMRERGKYGINGIIKCVFLDYFNFKLLNICTDVILPSEYAFELYKLKWKNLKQTDKIHIIPLMLPKREVVKKFKQSNLLYISFVGTINKARGIDELIRIGKILKKNNMGIKVKILTRQKVINKEGVLDIVFKKNITDFEISNFVENSLALMLTHTVAAQSGNIPVAYKVGTPIICNDVKGIIQQVNKNKTGYIITEDMNEDEIVNLFNKLILERDVYYKNCVEYFDRVFCENNFKRYYDWLV